jgi:acetylornithine/succinyldiaminopimelate/putrescine aminotransferase
MVEQPYPNLETTVDAYATHVAPGKVALYQQLEFLGVMGDRQGVWFEDAFSKDRLYNCHCNGGVFNLGHRHPDVIQAVKDALDTVDIGNHHLVSGYRALLAQRLAGTTDGQLSGVMFAASGAEAVDVAIKTVRGISGRSEIVSAGGSYHGCTGFALAAGDVSYRGPFGPNLPGFTQVPYGDSHALDRAVGGDTAAVILEAIPATLGMREAAAGYFRTVQDICRQRGAKLIIDEVQTGLGRTGRIWCFQHYDITPDAVITGKGLSGGIYPMAATLLSSELLHFYDAFPLVHFSTFGGAEPGCAAALAVLDIIEAPGFLERVEALGRKFVEGFLDKPFKLNGRGLMLGLEFPEENGGLVAMNQLRAAGVFVVYANHNPAAVQFLPPLVLTDDEADEIVARVGRAVA